MINNGKKFLTLAVLTLFVLSFTFINFPNDALGKGIEMEDLQPLIIIENVDIEQAVAGSDFTMTFSLRNLNKYPANNVKMSFKVDGTENADLFTLKDEYSDNTTIDTLEGNASRTVILKFNVSDKAQNKDYKMTVNVVGDNNFTGQKESVKTSGVFNIKVDYDLTKPVLMVSEATVYPENPGFDEEFNLNLRIVNKSKTTSARNVTLLLDGTVDKNENFEVLDITNRKNIAKLDEGDSAMVTYRLKAKDTKVDNTVNLSIDFDHQGETAGDPVVEKINLPLPDDIGVGAEPLVIVNKYTLSAERVLAGNTVTLKLFIENTNKRDVRNVKISLDVIEIEDDSVSGGVRRGGTVFSPVDSSNSFYLDHIPGKTVVEKDIDLYVDPNAAAKTYIVPVKIKYEDKTGTPLNTEELVNIPVTQECKLEVLSMDVPTTGFVGEPIPVMSEFVNVGKVALGNFMVQLEGEFEKQNATYYVGTFDIGISDYFQGDIIPQEPGTLEGKLVYTYIDNNNKDVMVEEPFTIEIEERPTPPPGSEGEMGPDGMGGPGMGDMPGDPGASFVAKLKAKAFNVVLGMVILFEAIYIWRLKKKKKEEEFFDE